jgi:DNA-binding NtrC family response regulator
VLKESEAVLVVDDEQAMVTYIADVIEGFVGLSTFKAQSAEAAREVFKKHGGRITTIISDMSMPGQAGTALMRELVAAKPDLRVIFVTGNLVDETTLAKLVGRPVALLMKPFGPFELKGLLERLAFNDAYETTV